MKSLLASHDFVSELQGQDTSEPIFIVSEQNIIATSVFDHWDVSVFDYRRFSLREAP